MPHCALPPAVTVRHKARMATAPTRYRLRRPPPDFDEDFIPDLTDEAAWLPQMELDPDADPQLPSETLGEAQARIIAASDRQLPAGLRPVRAPRP